MSSKGFYVAQKRRCADLEAQEMWEMFGREWSQPGWSEVVVSSLPHQNEKVEFML